MSRKSKVTPLEKVNAVERYLNGENSLGEAANSLGVGTTSIS